MQDLHAATLAGQVQGRVAILTYAVIRCAVCEQLLHEGSLPG